METIYDKIHTLSLDTDDKTHILDNLKQIEYKIIDVTTQTKTVEELKEYSFPVVINKDNAILYSYTLKEKQGIFMIIWKNAVLLDPQIIKIEITPTKIVT